MASTRHSDAGAAMRLPALIAHRGHTACCPENTGRALESAVDCGASYVEVDVQLSADGVPVLFHDDTLDRLCGVPGAVHECDWAALSGLRASDHGRFGQQFVEERLTPLSELATLLRAHARVNAFVEAKDIAIERFGAEVVLRSIADTLEAVSGQYILISFSLPFLELARQRTVQPLGAVVERWEERLEPRILALRPEYLFCDRNGLPATGPLTASGGSRIAVYEVADAEEALTLASRGVEFIETFAVGDMLRELRKRTTSRQGDD